MRIFNTGQISAEEKASILEKHRSVYDGYKTMQPEVKNEQPLYVYDPAQDKLGATMTNKGEVKPYTDYRINESKEQMCSECGGAMMEGECSECGWKGDMGESTGHLDDIYKVKDLNLKDGDFDYVEGGGNDYGTFEKLHKMKESDMEEGKLEDIKDKVMDWLDDEGESKLEKALKKIGDYLVDLEDKVDGVEKKKETKEDDNLTDNDAAADYFMAQDSGQETPHMADDMACDGMDDDSCNDRKMMADEEMKEQGGNADDMDVDDVEPAYDFVSDGPDGGGDEEYETMESAWSVNAEEPWSVYSDMKPAYDFDSEGPSKAGPFMTREQDTEEDDSENWEEIVAGEAWEEVDEDLKESFIKQKDKINEMFLRFKMIK